jgi:iron complex transport system permease protein
MNRTWPVHLLFLAAIGSIGLAPFFGAENVSFDALWGHGDNSAALEIYWKLHVPRVVAAFLTGMGLAVSGVVFQAIFRNPLATPFTLGTSSVASLGVAICLYGQWTFSLPGASSSILSGMLGAAVSIALLGFLMTRNRHYALESLLPAGGALAFFSTLLIIALYCVGEGPRPLYPVLRQTIGGFGGVTTYLEVFGMLPWTISGLLLIWYFTHTLNLLATGEDFAFSRGVNTRQTKLLLFLGVTMIVGSTTAVCGPIGLVGLIAPAVCRRLIGCDHRILMPASGLFGGAFLVICDTALRACTGRPELPVGLVTALLGSLLFLCLLLSHRRESDGFE